METTLYIKNMVCDRCIQAVRDLLTTVGLSPLSVELGVARLADVPAPAVENILRERLETLGFELITDRRELTVERIKNVVIKMVHYENGAVRSRKMSDYVAGNLRADYSSLSRLFSEQTGMTIERYFILQRIEMVKELLQYGELTINQIAIRLGYSSTAYLSKQFKDITGLTTTQFKAASVNTRRGLDKI